MMKKKNMGFGLRKSSLKTKVYPLRGKPKTVRYKDPC